MVWRPPPPARWPASAWLLVAANVVPLLGVLLLGWELGAIMLLFWAENVVVGVYHALRMALAAGWAALFLVPFFTLHYGIFTLVHGVFVYVLFAQGADWRVVVPGVIALLVSHGASFVADFLRGPERDAMRARGSQMMTTPYRRVVVLHLTIIFGGMLMLALGSPVWALVLLVALKTGIDLAAHLKDRERAADQLRPTPPGNDV